MLPVLHMRHLRLVDSTQSPSAEVAPNLIAAICFRVSSGRLMYVSLPQSEMMKLEDSDFFFFAYFSHSALWCFLAADLTISFHFVFFLGCSFFPYVTRVPFFEYIEAISKQACSVSLSCFFKPDFY